MRLKINRDLLINILDFLYELQGEWRWKFDVPYPRYQKECKELLNVISEVRKILEGGEKSRER